MKYTSSDSPMMKMGSRKQSTTDPSAHARVIQNRVTILKEKWDKLNDLLAVRKTRLQESIQSQQVRPLTIIISVCISRNAFQSNHATLDKC